MAVKIVRHLLWRRRVAAAHAWRDAERAEYERAVGRIIEQLPTGSGTSATAVMRWWEVPGTDQSTVPDVTVEPEREPSIMRELLTGMLPAEEVDRLEITPGQWYLPGIPP